MKQVSADGVPASPRLGLKEDVKEEEARLLNWQGHMGSPSFMHWDERRSQVGNLGKRDSSKGIQGIRSVDGDVARLSLFLLFPNNFMRVTSDGQQCWGRHDAGWMWQCSHAGGATASSGQDLGHSVVV